MATTRADTLTIQFDHRSPLTYTGGLRYGYTWDRLHVTTADGVDHEHDRWEIVGVEAANSHAAQAA